MSANESAPLTASISLIRCVASFAIGVGVAALVLGFRPPVVAVVHIPEPTAAPAPAPEPHPHINVPVDPKDGE